MFKKVFRRDFNWIFRYWWIGAVISVLTTVVASFMLRASLGSINSPEGSLLLPVLGILLSCAMYIAVICGYVAVWGATHYRFYRNFFTDEGYLTFTLPLKRRTLLLSKTLNSALWQVIHGALLVLCLILALVINLAGQSYGSSNMEALGDIIPWGWVALYLAELILITVGGAVLSTCAVELCITVGSIIASKHKLLVAVGIYYIGATVISTVGQAFTFLNGGTLIRGLDIITERASEGVGMMTFAIIGLWFLGAICTLAMALYLLTQHLIENKLNLD